MQMINGKVNYQSQIEVKHGEVANFAERVNIFCSWNLYKRKRILHPEHCDSFLP
jgi:hypothetical protein